MKSSQLHIDNVYNSDTGTTFPKLKAHSYYDINVNSDDENKHE